MPRPPLLRSLAPLVRGAGRRTVLLVVSLLALLALIATLTEPRPHSFPDQIQPAGPLVGDPTTLTVGIYATNNHAIDLGQPSFIAEGFIWLRWGPELDRLLQESAIDVDELITFENQIEGWDTSWIKASEKPRRLDDGSYYQLYQYSQKLYINGLSLRHYPFQDIDLPIVLEPNDQTDRLVFDRFRLVPDVRNTQIGSNIDVPGYVTHGWSFREVKHRYGSNFGLATKRTKVDNNVYSQLVFKVNYRRSTWASIWAMFQPLAVTLAVVMISPSLASNLWEVRLAIPTTVLLTLVFLQEGYKSKLPELPYLTYLDKVYAIAYLITLASFLLYLWGANQIAHTSIAADESEATPPSAALLTRLNHLDHRFQLWSLVAIVVLGAAAWFI